MKIEVLDHGFVGLIEAWGTGNAGLSYSTMSNGVDYEAGIIEAARQSTQGSFRGWEQDAKLLKYLYDHKHNTPFEFAGMVIEVQAPIFVFREWHRHRTQSYNEMSARYSPLPDLYYTPDPQILANRATTAIGNKQADRAKGVEETPTELILAEFREQLQSGYEFAEESYKQWLAWGIPKELARLIMPVGHYSKMRASANLRNWLAFLTLRLDPAAQWEIRQYAETVAQIMTATFPRTMALFTGEEARA